MNERLFHAGDVIAFYGRDLTSRIIELATLGPSHVGIVADMQGRKMLVEATTMCPWPCAVMGERIDGVQAHILEERIDTYPGSVWCHRLDPHWSLSTDESDLLTRILTHWIGTRYDLRGAVWSGTRILKWSRILPYSDLGSLFCSELLAAVLMRLGRLPVGNPGRYNPAGLIRTLQRACVYQRGFRLA